MRVIASAVVLGILVMLTSHADAQNRPSANQQQTLEQLDSREQFKSTLDRLDELKVLADKITRDKRAHCIRAFGHPEFCECLSQQTPVGASFQTYVAVVTQTKDELSDATLSSDD